MAKQSARLTQFYQDWNQWREDGADESSLIFSRMESLCLVIWDWMDLTQNMDHHEKEALAKEMENQFVDAGLHWNHPFTDGDSDAWQEQYDNSTMHLNERRIQWVKDHMNV